MDEFKIIVLPSNLNPGAPAGESLVLLFTIQEMETARQRGESMLRNRMKKGMSRDEAIGQCLKVS
jgi:hypothetical protein